MFHDQVHAQVEWFGFGIPWLRVGGYSKYMYHAILVFEQPINPWRWGSSSRCWPARGLVSQDAILAVKTVIVTCEFLAAGVPYGDKRRDWNGMYLVTKHPSILLIQKSGTMEEYNGDADHRCIYIQFVTYAMRQ